MKTPNLLETSGKKLDVLSANSAKLAVTSRKLGRMAGLSVVVLKACVFIPLTFTQLIVAVGTTIANAFGSIGSRQCRADLKGSLESCVFAGMLFGLSPILTANLVIKGFKGVAQYPTIPRITRNDMTFKK